MYGTHHKTGKKIRLLQYASSTWRDRKTLVWLTPEDDFTVPWNRYEIGVVGAKNYEAMKKKVDIDIVVAEESDVEWVRANYKKLKLVFASKALLDQIGMAFFNENKIGNILCLDELHTLYTFLDIPWDNTINDACLLIALVLRFAVTFPLEKTNRNIFTLKVGTQKTIPQKLYFITQYYKSKPKRQREIDFCLQKNIENPFIDKIILLNEEKYDIAKSEKVEQIILGKRLFYDDVIQYIAALPEDVLVVFANADIFLDSSIRYVWSTSLDNKFFALLRYDYADGKSQIFGPRADSQDTWIVSSKSVKERVWTDAIHFSFGISGCDNAICVEMLRMKFLVINPSLTIKTHHVHKSEIRTYSKDEIVEKEVYLYIDPTGLQDMEPILQIPAKHLDTTLEFSAFERPINCANAKAETYCTMLEKQKRYTFSPKEKNIFEKRQQPIYKFENVFQTNNGLIYGYDKIYVGPSKVALKYWSESNLSTLSQSVLSKKALITSLPKDVSSSVENYFLYYLPKILLMREKYDGDFLLPNNEKFIEALRLLEWKTRPQLISTETPVIYVKEAYVWFPSDNLEVGKEEVEILRTMLPNQMPSSEEETTVLYMDGIYINKTFVEECEKIYSNVKLIYPETSVDRKILILQSATMFISYCTPSIWKFLWAMKKGKFIDIQNELELNGEVHHLAAACGIEHVLHIIPKTVTPAIRSKILSSLSPSLETSLIDDLPTIYVPSEKDGFFHHIGDSFREIIDMWEERKYIKKEYGTNKNVWLGGIGQTLLYDRPTYDWIKNADADEQIWKKALFGNPKPIGPNSQAWSFWARRPRFIEAMLDKQIEPVQKTNGLVFYGVIENAIQNANRTKHDWASCCDKFVLAKEPAYTQQEYLDRMAKAKYGLCLAGFGKKCHREVECMAFGTVPVCAPEVDMENYANPPKEGVHYLRISSPEDALEKLSHISEECWQNMSDAGRLWYKENCSVDGLWNLTKKLIL